MSSELVAESSVPVIAAGKKEAWTSAARPGDDQA